MAIKKKYYKCALPSVPLDCLRRATVTTPGQIYRARCCEEKPTEFLSVRHPSQCVYTIYACD